MLTKVHGCTYIYTHTHIGTLSLAHSHAYEHMHKCTQTHYCINFFLFCCVIPVSVCVYGKMYSEFCLFCGIEICGYLFFFCKFEWFIIKLAVVFSCAQKTFFGDRWCGLVSKKLLVHIGICASNIKRIKIITFFVILPFCYIF